MRNALKKNQKCTFPLSHPKRVTAVTALLVKTVEVIVFIQYMTAYATGLIKADL